MANYRQEVELAPLGPAAHHAAFDAPEPRRNQRCCGGLTEWISRGACCGANRSVGVVTVYVSVCVFCSYFFLYPFRTPWAVGDWSEESHLGSQPKLILQLLHSSGYTTGKLLGIFVIPRISLKRCSDLLLFLPVVPTLMWIVLSVAHQYWFIFYVCFPVAPVFQAWGWGLLYRFIEGRAKPDIIGAVLSSSYILGAACSKWMGRSILQLGVSKYNMPMVISWILLAPYIVATLFTRAIPEPTEEEKTEMQYRTPMQRGNDWEVFKTYWVGFTCCTVQYAFLTAAKSFRDIYFVEIWKTVTDSDLPADLFPTIDVPVALFVFAGLACLSVIKDSRTNVFWQHGLMVSGYAIIFVSQILFWLGLLKSPELWIGGVGIGIYLGFTPVAAMFYDRLGAVLPKTRQLGTATFMIQVSDFVGNLGATIFYAVNLVGPKMNYYKFYSSHLFVASLLGSLLVLASWCYF